MQQDLYKCKWTKECVTHTVSLSVLLYRRCRQSTDTVSVKTLICYVLTAVCGVGRGQPSLIGWSSCLMKLISLKDMGIERFARCKELRLKRKPSQLDFLPCWIRDIRVVVISLVRAWRITRFDVYICPGVYVCLRLFLYLLSQYLPLPTWLPRASLFFTTYPVMRGTRDKEANSDHKMDRKRNLHQGEARVFPRCEWRWRMKVKIFS